MRTRGDLASELTSFNQLPPTMTSRVRGQRFARTHAPTSKSSAGEKKCGCGARLPMVAPGQASSCSVCETTHPPATAAPSAPGGAVKPVQTFETECNVCHTTETVPFDLFGLTFNCACGGKVYTTIPTSVQRVVCWGCNFLMTFLRGQVHGHCPECDMEVNAKFDPRKKFKKKCRGPVPAVCPKDNVVTYLATRGPASEGVCDCGLRPKYDAKTCEVVFLAPLEVELAARERVFQVQCKKDGFTVTLAAQGAGSQNDCECGTRFRVRDGRVETAPPVELIQAAQEQVFFVQCSRDGTAVAVTANDQSGVCDTCGEGVSRKKIAEQPQLSMSFAQQSCLAGNYWQSAKFGPSLRPFDPKDRPKGSPPGRWVFVWGPDGCRRVWEPWVPEAPKPANAPKPAQQPYKGDAETLEEKGVYLVAYYLDPCGPKPEVPEGAHWHYEKTAPPKCWKKVCNPLPASAPSGAHWTTTDADGNDIGPDECWRLECDKNPPAFPVLPAGWHWLAMNSPQTMQCWMPVPDKPDCPPGYTKEKPDLGPGEYLLIDPASHCYKKATAATDPLGGPDTPPTQDDGEGDGDDDGQQGNEEPEPPPPPPPSDPCPPGSYRELPKGADPGDWVKGLDGCWRPAVPIQEPEKCGPDVTLAMIDLLATVRADFNAQSGVTRTGLCYGVGKAAFWNAGDSWDIRQLFNDQVKGNRCPTPNCLRTVEFEKKCYNEGVVNYALYGMIWGLCANEALVGWWDQLNSWFNVTAYHSLSTILSFIMHPSQGATNPDFNDIATFIIAGSDFVDYGAMGWENTINKFDAISGRQEKACKVGCGPYQGTLRYNWLTPSRWNLGK